MKNRFLSLSMAVCMICLLILTSCSAAEVPADNGGANLDSGEVCDCTLTQVCAEARETFPERFTGKTDREVVAEIASVVKRAAQGATNPQDGETEHVDHAVSTSDDTTV